MQVSPQKKLPIIWNGADPSDTDTLYVQTVVKDAITLVTLNTVNLTDNGNHLFSGSFTTPADPSQTGTGRWIILTTTVYTDAARTIKSQNYQRVTDQYLVKQIVDPSTFLGGGGGVLDYREIKKIVQEVLDEAKPAAPLVLKQEFPIQAIIKAVRDEIKNIPEAPEPAEPVDLSPLHNTLDTIQSKIEDLPPPTPKTDLMPVLKEVRARTTSLETLIQDVFEKQSKQLVAQLIAGNEDIVKTITTEIINQIVEQVKNGKLLFSLFSDNNPFDTTKQKKENYLKSLASQFK